MSGFFDGVVREVTVVVKEVLKDFGDGFGDDTSGAVADGQEKAAVKSSLELVDDCMFNHVGFDEGIQAVLVVAFGLGDGGS